MKSGIALVIFVVGLGVVGPAVAGMSCNGHVANQNTADAPPSVTAMIGLVLFLMGSVTRRSTMERA